MNRLSALLSRTFTALAVVGLVAMMVHINVDVVGRYLFNWSAPATLEMVSYYYMAGAVLLPLAALEQRGSLVHVELFYDRMPPGARRVILTVALFLSAAYCATVAYAAWSPAMKAYHAGTYAGSTFPVITWPTRFFPVLGFGLLALVMLLKAITIAFAGPDSLHASQGTEPFEEGV